MYQTETIIALGSNLGNAIFNLRCAVRELENIGNIKKYLFFIYKLMMENQDWIGNTLLYIV